MSRFRLVIVLPALLIAGTLPTGWQPAAAQANSDFFGNLFRPPGQVRSGNQNAAPSEDPGALSARIDRIEDQLRQMTGMIEQLQFRNQQLEAQVRTLQGLPAASGAPAGAPAMPASPALGGGSDGGRRSDTFDPSSQPAAPGAPRPLGATQPSGAPLELGSLSGAAANQVTLPPSNSPKDLYDLAYGYMLQQQYDQSAQSFERFVELYPQDRATPDAYYWLGETQYLRKSYKEAAQSFLKVSTDYPNAVKAPDALLRLGQSLAAIGEKDAACATLNAVGNKYPRASATIKQGVQQEQKRAGC